MCVWREDRDLGMGWGQSCPHLNEARVSIRLVNVKGGECQCCQVNYLGQGQESHDLVQKKGGLMALLCCLN